MSRFDPITLEILWSRLISIVDEAAATLVRTSFSTTVRESNDFACVLLDVEGHSLAQSTRSIPSFTATLPKTLRKFFEIYPAASWVEADAVISNDPWIGTGHLNDINMAVPIFARGRLLGFAASVAHAPDIGGRMRSADNRELFEEGIRIPITKWMQGGVVNRDVEQFIAQNVRVADQVIGDLHAQRAANQLAARRLMALVEEHEIGDLRELAKTIQSASERQMRSAIEAIPDGSYTHEAWLDGFDEPLVIRLQLRKLGSEIVADYSGTSDQVGRALNVVPSYTFAYTAYALKCAVSPGTPNNEGCFRPLEVVAPEGSLLNPRFPAAVGARALVGHYLPSVVFGALQKVLPDHVQAASGSPIWAVNPSGVDAHDVRFAGVFFLNGGQGASSRQDGLSCLSFPSNISNTPAEVIEHTFPLKIERKELLRDSGGPGRYRGGLGQRIDVRVESKGPMSTVFLSERTKFPAEGLHGGQAGAVGRLLLNGNAIDPKHARVLQPGDLLQVETPGGGGWGEPDLRSREAVLNDVANGLVSPEAAARSYGVVATPEPRTD